jgi:hypothetical protein
MSATTTTTSPPNIEISESDYGKLIFAAMSSELQRMSKKPEDSAKRVSDERSWACWGECCVAPA